MKHGTVIGILFGLAMGRLLGNAGGYFRGGVEHAGDVRGFEPSATGNIRILDEKLTVNLGSQDADVEVRYLMRNETAKRTTVRFGFPVEESFDNNNYGNSSQPTDTWTELRYCKDYRISASGKALKAKWLAESNNPGKNADKAAADVRFKGIAGWLVSEMTFNGGEEIPVQIRFRSVYPKSAYGSSGAGASSAALFRYRLSSAACWAGTIGSGHIVLKPAGIDPRELKVLKPVNRFRKQGDSWIWDFENLEPTLADDLEIEAAPAVTSHYAGAHAESEYYQSNGEWYIITNNYKAKASSVKAPDGKIDYAVTNLNDGFPNNAWCEGRPGPGVGEWLELRPEVARPLRAIVMLPGYQESEGLFRANARPKRVKVVLNDENTFTVDVPDKRAKCCIPVRGYAKPVRVVKLTFEEVWPGDKFEDLCVSGVDLEVRLDKKPKLPPVR